MCTDLAQRLLVDFSQPGRRIPRNNEVDTSTVKTYNKNPAI